VLAHGLFLLAARGDRMTAIHSSSIDDARVCLVCASPPGHAASLPVRIADTAAARVREECGFERSDLPNC
jgi:hypothetical protein